MDTTETSNEEQLLLLDATLDKIEILQKILQAGNDGFLWKYRIEFILKDFNIAQVSSKCQTKKSKESLQPNAC